MKFCVYGASHRIEKIQDRQLRLVCHPELRRRGRGLGFQRGGRQFIGRWEEQMLGKQMFVMPRRDNGTRGLSLEIRAMVAFL